MRDNMSVDDSISVEVKGPDPGVWGQDEKRPAPVGEETGPGIGEIHAEGTENEIKGPGPEWETDEEGRYVNRG